MPQPMVEPKPLLPGTPFPALEIFLLGFDRPALVRFSLTGPK